MVKPITKSVREYLADIGAKGGKASSKAKVDAAKKNGKKGGRPKSNGKPARKK